MSETFKIYGSDKDLSAFEKQLKDAGFDKLKDDPIQSNGFPNVISIKYVIASGIGNCIKTLLSTRNQRMVSTGKDSGKIIIKGGVPADEIEKLLKCSIHFEIQNEIK